MATPHALTACTTVVEAAEAATAASAAIDHPTPRPSPTFDGAGPWWGLTGSAIDHRATARMRLGKVSARTAARQGAKPSLAAKGLNVTSAAPPSRKAATRPKAAPAVKTDTARPRTPAPAWSEIAARAQGANSACPRPTSIRPAKSCGASCARANTTSPTDQTDTQTAMIRSRDR